jgi:hypothetical protein
VCENLAAPPVPVAVMAPAPAAAGTAVSPAARPSVPAPQPAPASPAVAPPPEVADTTEPRAPRVPVAIVPRAWVARQGIFDVVVYDDALVLAKPRGKRSKLAQLSPGQVAGLHEKNRLVPFGHISDIDIWERPTGGQATVWLADGSRLVFSWLKPLAGQTDVSALLTDAMPAKVDLAEPSVVVRVARIALRVAAVMVVLVGLKLGLGVLLRADPPRPAPPAPPPTLSPAQRVAHDELAKACAPWRTFLAQLAPGERPDPGALRPIVDGMRPRFDAAAVADPSLVPATSELGWLQDYARRPPPEAAKESGGRITYAVRTVDSACSRAGG